MKENKIRSFISSYPLLIVVIVLLLGFCAGAFVFGHHHEHDAQASESGKEIYTCSMHPQIKQDHPGKCPICGMDLIPAAKQGSQASMTMDSDPSQVQMSDEAVALANIQTEVIGSGAARHEVRLLGKIQPDARTEQVQSAYVAGRIERLLVNAVGDRVSKGQTLAIIYSPELYATQQELVAALSYPASPQRKTLVEAAVEKLRLLNVTPAQISQILKTRKISPFFPLKANTSGTIVERLVEQGDYVQQGAPVLKVANLNTVWAVFQAYESDLPFLHKGDEVNFTTEALPGRTFKGRISFIDPVIDAATRTAGVRVVMSNPGGLFKPEMLLTGNASASMSGYKGAIIVPKSAVLWTGRRSVVWVKEDDTDVPTFDLREVTLGPSLGDSYIITDGLAEGEEVVTNGAFAVDASAQLAGKNNMMNH